MKCSRRYSPKEEKMPQDIQKLAKDYLAAWNSHDWNKVSQYFPDDGVYEGLASGMVCHGKQEFKAYFEGTVAWSSDFKIASKSLFVAGDWIANEWTMSGTHSGDTPGMPATGKKYSIPGASIMEFHNGKLKRHSDYWSLFTFLQQVGLMPGAPA